MNGNQQILELLIQHNADVNQCDKNHSTPLHLAVYQNHINTVKTLLQHGANVNQKLVDDGATALHLAAASRNGEIAKLLLDNGAEIEATTTRQSASPLLYAAEYGNLEMFKLLIQRGANQFATANVERHYAPYRYTDMMLEKYNAIELARFRLEQALENLNCNYSRDKTRELNQIENLRTIIDYYKNVSVNDNEQSERPDSMELDICSRPWRRKKRFEPSCSPCPRTKKTS